MGIFAKENDSVEIEAKNVTPRDFLTNVLKATSGSNLTRGLNYSIFYNVIGFRGIRSGIGTSSLVANLALALARLGLKVCVVDTSFLNPSQDVLLNTDYKNPDRDKRLDWLDMGYSKESVLHQSKFSSSVAVLSMVNRTIVDMLSTSDDSSLVELAVSQLSTKFDMILIDICDEPTAIASACLQQAQKIIQVWDNSPQSLVNLPNFLTNTMILACPLDKMRYVVTSMVMEDIKTDWDALMKKYKFKHLSNTSMSMDVARILATGKPVFNYASMSKDIQQYNDCLTDIACNLLSIDLNNDKPKGTITSEDILNGDVEGTLAKKLKDAEKDFPEIYTQIGQGEKKTEHGIPERQSTVEETASSGVDLDLFGDAPAEEDAFVQQKKSFLGRKRGN